ncbi:IucA/IucC family protein (plasmid) [Pseudoalteromonas espejiana]
MPAHPWQYQHKLSVVFANEFANNRLVYLGEGDDLYQAQHPFVHYITARTHINLYLKVALFILNMGFMRGLACLYGGHLAINDWVFNKVKPRPNT